MFTLPSHLVGLESLLDQLTRHEKASHLHQGYPPYNVSRSTEDDSQYMIEIACAGFDREELSVEFADDTLTISGKKDNSGKEYLYKGIGTRDFSRSFILSPDMRIRDVALENGLLKVLLEKEIPEHKKRRKIEINSSLAIDNDRSHLKLAANE